MEQDVAEEADAHEVRGPLGLHVGEGQGGQAEGPGEAQDGEDLDADDQLRPATVVALTDG